MLLRCVNKGDHGIASFAEERGLFNNADALYWDILQMPPNRHGGENWFTVRFWDVWVDRGTYHKRLVFSHPFVEDTIADCKLLSVEEDIIIPVTVYS